jgi:hypothetical protein
MNTVHTKVKLSVQQDMQAYEFVRCRGSQDSQLAVRLSTLHAGRALPPEICQYLFLFLHYLEEMQSLKGYFFSL